MAADRSPEKSKLPGAGGTQGRDRERTSKVSKWASLFDAGGGSHAGAGGGQESNADAWFDKIFPKSSGGNTGSGNNVSQGSKDLKENLPAVSSAPTPRLSAQQEKSIQQLQTLVKTLGVATRNSSASAAGGGTGRAAAAAGGLTGGGRRNKPAKLRPAPVQGGAVDPVPFSSILKKLQTVSSSAGQGLPEQKQQQEAATAKPLERFKSEIVDDEDEDEDDDEEGDELSEEEEEEEEEESELEIEAVVGSSSEDEEESPTGVLEAEKLKNMTVVALKSLAKERGLSGYSKMKKDELVQLLS